MKRAARQPAAPAMVGTRLWPMVPPGMAVILRYHRVASHLVPLSVTAREFEAQLRFLRRRCAG